MSTDSHPKRNAASNGGPARRRRLLLAAVVVCAAVFAAPPAGASHEGSAGAKNVVQVFNEADGTQRAQSATQVSSVAAPTAEPENLAHAQSSCTDCRTVAVAVQAVLITTDDANVIVPKNAAVAVNTDCQGCETAAFAYQCVVTTTGPVVIGADGERRIAELRAEIDAIAHSQLKFPDLDAQLDGLVAQLWAVIDVALEGAGEENRCGNTDGGATSTI